MMSPWNQPYPSKSWSDSRDRTFITCRREYRYKYYSAFFGMRADASEEDRVAYVSKQLTNLHLEVGKLVHKFADENILALLRGLPLLSYETMLERARAELNRVCLSSRHRDAFLRLPNQHAMLRSEWVDGRRDEGEVERVREKLPICLENLATHSLFRCELAELSPAAIHRVDRFSSFKHRGVTVFAAFDLAYEPEPHHLVIGDWKTGAEDGAQLQLANYALFCRDGLGIPFREGCWRGRVMNVWTGQDSWYEISALDLYRAEQRIRESVAAMDEYLVDPDQNIPKPVAAFPLTSKARRSRCPTCPFYTLCLEELETAA